MCHVCAHVHVGMYVHVSVYTSCICMSVHIMRVYECTCVCARHASVCMSVYTSRLCVYECACHVCVYERVHVLCMCVRVSCVECEAVAQKNRTWNDVQWFTVSTFLLSRLSLFGDRGGWYHWLVLQRPGVMVSQPDGRKATAGPSLTSCCLLGLFPRAGHVVITTDDSRSRGHFSYRTAEETDVQREG